MYRVETVKRYTSFLNELITLANSNAGKIMNLHEVIKHQGISGRFITYIHKNGIIAGNAKTGHTMPLTPVNGTFKQHEVALMIKKMNNETQLAKQKRQNNKTIAEPNDRPLARYHVNDLIKELKQRGYTGNIEISKRVQF